MHHPARLQLLLVPIVALVLASCSSCASTAALKNHSTAAQTLDDLAARGREVVMEMRQASLDKALAGAQEAGEDPVPAVKAAAADFDARAYIPALNAFINAKDAYVRVVLVAAGKDEPDWTSAKPALRSVVEAYAALRSATGDKMPPVPKVVLDILSP